MLITQDNKRIVKFEEKKVLDCLAMGQMPVLLTICLISCALFIP